MKRKIVLLMAVLALVALGSAVAENWVKFLETPIGGKFFIDTDSITFIGNNRISVWIKQADTTGYVMFQYFIDFLIELVWTFQLYFTTEMERCFLKFPLLLGGLPFLMTAYPIMHTNFLNLG